MILHLYSLKNRLSGQFERPVAEIYDAKQYFEYLGQSLAYADVPVLERYKECDVYFVGNIDTKTGIVTGMCEEFNGPDFLGSLEPLCISYINMKAKKNEQAKDGE